MDETSPLETKHSMLTRSGARGLTGSAMYVRLAFQEAPTHHETGNHVVGHGYLHPVEGDGLTLELGDSGVLHCVGQLAGGDDGRRGSSNYRGGSRGSSAPSDALDVVASNPAFPKQQIPRKGGAIGLPSDVWQEQKQQSAEKDIVLRVGGAAE